MAGSSSGGMEEIVAADSAITWIDGRQGELRYRGYAIGELAGRYSFEEVAGLLWDGELPEAGESQELAGQLRRLRLERAEIVSLLDGVPPAAHPLDVLRFAVSWDALGNSLTWDSSGEANRRKSLEFTAWFPVLVAGYHRRRLGQDPVAPDPNLDTAANFLWMLRGRLPREEEAGTLDTSLILHADHELNASTFAARVTIATQSSLHAAIASALGTLSGPRHGGASEHVIRMLEEIGSPEGVEEYVQARLATRQRIMGFGHRVYRTADPRSRHLREMAAIMLAGTPHESWMETLKRLSEVMERERGLYPNVDLYAAVVNHELGIDPAFYTSIFAISRIVGWTAHAIEQLDGRMIRPAARYIGPAPRTVLEGSAV